MTPEKIATVLQEIFPSGIPTTDYARAAGVVLRLAEATPAQPSEIQGQVSPSAKKLLALLNKGTTVANATKVLGSSRQAVLAMMERLKERGAAIQVVDSISHGSSPGRRSSVYKLVKSS